MDELRLTGLANMRTTPLDAPDVFGKALEERAPRFRAAAEATVAVVGMTMTAVHQALAERRDAVGEATRNLLTHIANDFLDLTYDLVHGRGRSAMKSARSLYEHQIAIELVMDPTLAQRYIDHDAVGLRYFGDLERPEAFLAGNDLRSYRHRRHKIERDARRDAETAISTYGAAFARGWAPKSLRDHATDLGRDADYAFYRVASLPTHGASAGIYGNRQPIGTSIVHRTGPALAACSLAAPYGLAFSQISLEVADPTVGHGALGAWRERLEHLMTEVSAYMAAVEEMDRDLWPETPPVNAAPMLVVDTYENVSDWLAMPEGGLAFPYDGPFLVTAEQAQTRDALIQEILPKLQIDHLGLMFINAQGLDFSRVRFDRPRRLYDVVGLGILGIDPSGTVLAERGMEVVPFVDDILGRKS